jgi:5-methylcytosine-specific restriction endonuclease McrA
MPERYKRNPNTKCAICGKEIYRRPVQIKMGGGKSYCGQACFGISCRNEKPCIICNKLILSGLHRITCSRTCSNINREGIKYRLGKPKDKSETFRLIKIGLFSSRGGKCERCGYSKREILHVHHKDRDRKNNGLDNLELICPNCHFEDHHLEKSLLQTRRGVREV